MMMMAKTPMTISWTISPNGCESAYTFTFCFNEDVLDMALRQSSESSAKAAYSRPRSEAFSRQSVFSRTNSFMVWPYLVLFPQRSPTSRLRHRRPQHVEVRLLSSTVCLGWNFLNRSDSPVRAVVIVSSFPEGTIIEQYHPVVEPWSQQPNR